MIETVLKIDGMMCGMCEAHMNEAIRRAISVKKVTSSHKKGETVLITDERVDAEKLNAAISSTGYRVLNMDEHPYEKKGLFSFLKK